MCAQQSDAGADGHQRRRRRKVGEANRNREEQRHQRGGNGAHAHRDEPPAGQSGLRAPLFVVGARHQRRAPRRERPDGGAERTHRPQSQSAPLEEAAATAAAPSSLPPGEPAPGDGGQDDGAAGEPRAPVDRVAHGARSDVVQGFADGSDQEGHSPASHRHHERSVGAEDELMVGADRFALFRTSRRSVGRTERRLVKMAARKPAAVGLSDPSVTAGGRAVWVNLVSDRLPCPVRDFGGFGRVLFTVKDFQNVINRAT